MTKPLLTIAIPTYNRCQNVIKQLYFFKKELNTEILSKVEFVIYNNASTDNTEIELDEFSRKNNWVNYTTNIENLGLVGNVNKALLESKSLFTWVVGDDDNLVTGILKEVIQILEKNLNISWLFLNHDAFEDSSNRILMSTAFNVEEGLYEDGKKAICEVFLASGTTPMFITACIYKSEVVRKIVQQKNSNNLVNPLEYSFYSASKGPVYLFKEVLIHNRWGTSSWSDESEKIMYYGVFNVFNNLKLYSYDLIDVKKLRQINLQRHLPSQLKNLLKDKGFSLSLFKLYNTAILATLIKLVINKIGNKS